MIKVSALNKAFGGLRAVRNLSFEAIPHRVTSIIGPNGAGKSTAFNLIAGTLRPDSGTVELEGRDITGQAPFALARLGVARSFQITNLFFGLSAFENVRLACQSLERRNRYLVRALEPFSRSLVCRSARTSSLEISRMATSAGSRSPSAWRLHPAC